VTPTLDDLPPTTKTAWLRLRDELHAILGEDLVAIWAYGSTIAPDRPHRSADLDTHVIVRRPISAQTAQQIQEKLEGARTQGAEFDIWFIHLDDARRPESPPHAFREGRRDTAWALHRAHWLAGSYINVYGQEPTEVVLAPTWQETTVDLDRELEHVERHLTEGDTDPYEASYAILNGSRILRALETRDAVLTKRGAGEWALDHLPDRWHPAIRAALRAYDERQTPEDADLLASEVAPFVAFVRERLPAGDRPPDETLPRWSGY
jgi:hypothetical protein